LETYPEKHYDVPVHGTFGNLNWKLDITVHIDIGEIDGEVVTVSAPFDGTLTDDKGVKHAVTGAGKIDEPILRHLKDIHADGKAGDLTFKSVNVIKVWDIMKKHIPFHGDWTFSDGHKDKIVGYAVRPSYEE